VVWGGRGEDTVVLHSGARKPPAASLTLLEAVQGILLRRDSLLAGTARRCGDPSQPRTSGWHGTATHAGPLGAVPATGKRISVDGLIIDLLADGKVKERWEQWDQSLMLQQLSLA
jgi:hypothetical protein